MSMTTCTDCGRFIDTDDEPEAYDAQDKKARCENCRMELEEEVQS